MKYSESRTFVNRVHSIFNPLLLTELRIHMDTIWTEQQVKAKTDREQIAINNGTASDALRMDSRWYDVWCGLTPQMIEVFSPYTWVIFPPMIRIVREQNHLVPWHQDIGYMRLLGARGHNQIITCFIPIDKEPSKHTTLQFALDELPELEHVSTTDYRGVGIKDANFSKLEYYELELGDCLVFGDLAAHRTFVPPNARLERRSLEFRLTQPNMALSNKDYFDIESSTFIHTDD